MNLSHRLGEYIAACFTGIWVQSHEHPDALNVWTGKNRAPLTDILAGASLLRQDGERLPTGMPASLGNPLSYQTATSTAILSNIAR
jgi:hypothetical protein